MPGYIYFVFDPPKNRIKIGSSERLIGRLSTHIHRLQVEVLGYMPGTRADEDLLHAKFTQLRIEYSRKRGGGRHRGDKGKEWYQDDPELRDYIAANARPWDRAATFLWEGKTPSFAMHGSDQWIAWLEEFASELDTGVGALVEQALTAFAREKHFRTPPNR